ncbi:MAG: NifB/NifX family molybdenum-iron cluster-binding protein [Deltaproteobacteria bacterium]|nr:NifB/NifX family molybdenum-iron cluster-binding protein [Deltaproteobacteria bacterium]MBW1954469.1 NifB/NifX family molybdenum-iron cluster-binding protein [Deltaproteobacteria bacterium]MBW2042128.1 NifB/NifX family molybdenum-iron cluster-binding protein [Deltaproteobacteria bacterium]MBW2132314.1 NifB/NifX family molybdenum-iron cluster-binding protein [Deltaproteobacteria bacterium]
MTKIIAVPSLSPGGLDASISAHFGHCEIYTLLSVEEGEVQDVRVIPNVPHQQGGCMAPVNHLADHGVNVLIAGGMGMRPLMGFHQVGIDVFHCGMSQTVGEAVGAYLQGSLPAFGQMHTCGGGDPHHAHP